MTARPPKEVFLGLDMPFSEAVERFIGANPKELEANTAKKKRRKKKPGVPPPGSKSETVISLKDRKASRRRRGIA